MTVSRRTGTDKWDRNQIRQLFKQYRETHDVALRDQLVVMHINLARFIASKFGNRGESLDDLNQVGSLALLKAIDRYDPEVGVEFTTYATPTIIGEIKRHFRDKAWSVKVPRRLQDLKMVVGRMGETLTNELGRSPTINEIAHRLGLSQEEVLEAQELGQVYNLLSLDTDLEGEDDKKASHLLDYMGRRDLALENVDNQVILERGFSHLAGRERLVLFLRFYLNLSQSEIARLLDISQMHVSRLQHRALQKLKDRLAETPE